MWWLAVDMVVLMLFACVLCGLCDFVCMRFVVELVSEWAVGASVGFGGLV